MESPVDRADNGKPQRVIDSIMFKPDGFEVSWLRVLYWLIVSFLIGVGVGGRL